MDKVRGAVSQFFYTLFMRPTTLQLEGVHPGLQNSSFHRKSEELLFWNHKRKPNKLPSNTFLGGSWLRYARRRFSQVAV